LFTPGLLLNEGAQRFENKVFPGAEIHVFGSCKKAVSAEASAGKTAL
jgi:hypothetical protein